MTAAHPGDSFAPAGGTCRSIEPLLKGRRLTKPLIAAVEGPAIAGGTEILQATDIRVAGESARFGVSEARWGLFPLGGSAVRLPRQIPYTVAADLLLTGRHITAAEALADRPDRPRGARTARRWRKALELAEMIAANGPLAVRAILRTIRETEGMPRTRRSSVEARLGMEVFAQRGRQGGPAGLREKRKPGVPRALGPAAVGQIGAVAALRPSTGRAAVACTACRSGRAAARRRSRRVRGSLNFASRAASEREQLGGQLVARPTPSPAARPP